MYNSKNPHEKQTRSIEEDTFFSDKKTCALTTMEIHLLNKSLDTQQKSHVTLPHRGCDWITVEMNIN